MQYELMKLSLDIINSNFREQAEVRNLYIESEYKQEYRICDIQISTQLSLFETHSLVSDISKALHDTSNPDELKTSLSILLKIAKENIELYDSIREIVNNSENGFFECAEVIRGLVSYYVDDKQIVWLVPNNTQSPLFGGTLRIYKHHDFLEYSKILHTFLNQSLTDWIKTKEDEKTKRRLEIKNLDKQVHWWKDIRWYGGLLAGMVAMLGTLATIYYTSLKCK